MPRFNAWSNWLLWSFLFTTRFILFQRNEKRENKEWESRERERWGSASMKNVELFSCLRRFIVVIVSLMMETMTKNCNDTLMSKFFSRTITGYKRIRTMFCAIGPTISLSYKYLSNVMVISFRFTWEDTMVSKIANIEILNGGNQSY